MNNWRKKIKRKLRMRFWRFQFAIKSFFYDPRERYAMCDCGILHFAPEHRREPNVDLDLWWDSDFCTVCNRWLDNRCNDPECVYCTDRTPSYRPINPGTETLSQQNMRAGEE